MVSKHFAVGVCDPSTVFAHRLAVFALEDWFSFAMLSSSLNDAWARKHSSSLESRLNYSPSDAFDTLPRPSVEPTALAELGRRYDEMRRRICTNHQVGLTDLYNSFHDPDHRESELAVLRKLLVDIDKSLVVAYGWEDVNLDYGFHEVPSLPAR